jgi:hypothetical protein
MFIVVSMAQTPKKPQQPPLTRRARSRHERELQRQRLVIIISGIAIGLALLAVLIGVGYDQLWLPSRPVAQVNSAALSRRDYWTERRNELARQVAQTMKNLTLLGSLGPQFTQQLAGQIPALNDQAASIRTAAVDDPSVNSWIERQVIAQAATTMNIQANDGEIAQALLSDLGSAFPPPPPPPTTTATLEPTAAITGTASITGTAATTATAQVSATAAVTPTVTPGGPTATSAPTNTPAPTDTPAPSETPTATPLPDAALAQQDGVVGRLFDAYSNEILNSAGKINLTLDDFKAALHDQYLRQVLTNKIEAQLLPENTFTLSTDPSSIETSHILIAVTTPISATEAEREAAYAARKPDAEAILQQLRGGADFATLAKEKSDDAATKDNGGTLPSFDKDGKTQEGSALDPEVVKAALALKEGEISDLIRTPFGWHLIKLDKITVPSKEEQLQQARTKKFDEWLAQQRGAATIEHFPPQTPEPSPLPTQPVTAPPLPTVSLHGTPTATPTATAVPTATVALPGTPTATPTP